MSVRICCKYFYSKFTPHSDGIGALLVAFLRPARTHSSVEGQFPPKKQVAGSNPAAFTNESEDSSLKYWLNI